MNPKVSRRQFIGQTVPTDPGDGEELNQYELMMDAAWKSKYALKGDGTQASPGDSIFTIPDLIGNRTMNYVGEDTLASAALQGTAPVMQASKGIRVHNIPTSDYGTSTYSLVSYPFEVTDVGENLPTQAFEAKNNNYPADSYRGYHGSDVRAGQPDLIIVGSGLPPLFTRLVEHYLFDVDGVSHWRNGVYKGKVLWGSGRVSHKTLSSIFTNTNNFSWDMIATYEKYGKFSDSDRTAYLASLGALHNQGQLVQLPYADNISEVYNTTTQTWSETHTPVNRLGTTITATKRKWILNRRATGQGDFGDQRVVGTDETLPRSSYASLVDNFDGEYHIKAYIQLEDAQGNTYGYTSSDGYADE